MIEYHIKNQPKHFAWKFDEDFESQVIKYIQDEKFIVAVCKEDNEIVG